jgi:hypothetical protein
LFQRKEILGLRYREKARTQEINVSEKRETEIEI